MANLQRNLVLENIQNLKNFLKENQEASLKLLENIGRYPYVIQFSTFNKHAINLTIQINDQFDLSNIKVKANRIDKDNLSDESLKLFEDFLNEKMKTIDSQSEIFLIKLFQKSKKYVEKHFEKSCIKCGKISPTFAKPEYKKNDEILNTKKVSMKTAGDVVNRIQWDQEINKDFITVGYIDRFLGLKECDFNTFDWGDIVLADYGALAIPEHRISYFKYKDEIIWDKKSRLDNIFGSTGSAQTIRDVIKRLENFNFEPKNETTVKISEIKDQNLELDAPNYFISVPISSFQIKLGIDRLNSDLFEYNEQVESFLVPNTSFHLTLCTLRIDNDNEMNTVKQIIDKSKDNLKDNFPIKIKFQGLDQFFEKVLFIKCNNEDTLKLKYLKEYFLTQFEEKNVNTAGNYYNFVPHLTVFKIKSNPNNRNINVDDFIDKNLWEKYKNFNFGEEILNQIQLCKMTNIMHNKIYPIEHEINM